jgi:hypothetical protein
MRTLSLALIGALLIAAAGPPNTYATDEQTAVDYVLSLYDPNALGGTARRAPRSSGFASPSKTAMPAWISR